MKLLITTQIVDLDDPILGFFHRWIEAFAAECESVLVICLKEGRHSLPSNVRVLSLRKESGASRFAYLSHFYRYIWRERNEYDAVFVHMNQVYVLLGGLLWRLWGKRIGLWYVHRSVTLSLRLATTLVDYVFTTSIESFRIDTPKRVMLGHGIDTTHFAPRHREKSDMLRILTVGRIAPSKRLMEMLAIVEELHAHGTAVSFSIVGSGVMDSDRAYEESLRARVRERGLDRSVRFEGAQSQEELPDAYAAADVFLNLSTTGSMDKAVLEALACGVPVVTSNAAFRDLLAPYGLFIEGADPKAVAEAVLRARGMDMTPLVEKVRAGHSLQRLIPAIIEILAR